MLLIPVIEFDSPLMSDCAGMEDHVSVAILVYLFSTALADIDLSSLKRKVSVLKYLGIIYTSHTHVSLFSSQGSLWVAAIYIEVE